MRVFKTKKNKGKSEMPPVFMNWVRKRIRRNQNAIIIFNGGTGSGKSYACLRLACDIAEEFGTPFSIDGNIDFSFEHLLKKMQQSQNENPGTVFLQEEVGAFGSGASSREWQSKANKFFNSFLQTSRHRQQILIMNCPSFGYLEAGSRQLVHFQFEALYVDPTKAKSYFKPFAIQCNRRTGKLYFKYLRYSMGKKRNCMNVMSFGLPPKDIRADYEKEKRKFTDKLNTSILDPKKKMKPIILPQFRKEVAIALKNTGKTEKEIAETMGLTRQAINYYFSKNNPQNDTNIAVLPSI